MTIAKRLYALILSVVLGLAALAGFGIYQMDRVYTAASYATVNTVPSLLTLNQAFVPFAQMRTAVWQHMASKDAAGRDKLEAGIREARAAVGKALDQYEKDDVTDEQDRALLAADRAVLARYDTVRDKVLALSKAGEVDAARDLLMENQPIIKELVDALAAHHRYNENVSAKGAADGAAAAASARWISIGLALAVTALVAGMGLLLARRIAASLASAIDVARTIAGGDLSVQVNTASTDEVGQLMKAMADMSASLVRIVAEVRSGTDSIGTASGQIAAGNLDLSARTEQQAGSLEETASAMEELTATVRQNADNARQAKQMAVSASDKAQRGGAVMDDVIRTMEAIDSSSNKIADIISVIDGIAFQTNILALNAAVEAARAGEQGRGFAVVATEVRNLAHRSAAAAKEIKVLIGDSVEQVEQGGKLVRQAGAAMTEVVDTARGVTDIVSEISAASAEQSTGIEEINRAVTQMDEVTQQNAALVEEAAAASQSLQEQAARLAGVVGAFKLAPAQAGAAPQAHAARRPAQHKAALKLVATRPAGQARAAAPATADAGDWDVF
ncbi:methyl-accepting chemotaxis protein I [Janthinobacterium sp. HH103]|uniref:methyl-accepting chemotaxis protein n=1 Tax=unclassified Janthinobacterium TaxID=2610881 RepID=UPI000892D777|nr:MULTISPECIES: methyl-accepting chemotaxis protein [unclassified Janthinobacterium]OEZ54207.1 methyl-accepting chemotaxis protein I [Janthinobacterium sp. HH100]OEZ69822.1 methyl-accepting chemotaxis protein I [Janthinobacterium sp. HH103]QOU73482.1 Methyl-accepting chemotaxis protein I [Janthinobacterium sp. HH102]